ncbi:hypothetical protein CLV30_103185 [Haloactinopolyspora alba]|uniref:Uncharacterized protein n=1 Tax=Haloactinopolyspora alba TaxID=648780 RepID=A0A2P8E975_9ACTN|nr:hypothetical protein CLV30_103185 [Haloactinopolyspora alba]
MSGFRTDAPVALPVLSRGKHRSARKGACFMEFASYLAGERWSDHPSCTHPLLAAVARLVNDTVSDDYRPRLAPMIPSVIGLNSDDPRLDARVALRAATTALPVASAERQRVLAVAVLAAERVLKQLDHRTDQRMTDRSIVAMAKAPDAARWARGFAAEEPTTVKGFQRYAAPTAVRTSVEGIAQACIPDPDQVLHDVLAGAIEDARAFVDRGHTAVHHDDPRWVAACGLTGTVEPR